MSKHLDSVDKKIIEILKENGRISYTELAKALGLSDVGVKKRVEKLVSDKVIRKFTVDINYEKLGKPITALVLIRGKLDDQLISEIVSHQEVIEHHRTLGEYDLVLKVVMENINSLQDFVQKFIGGKEEITEIRTLVVL